MLERIPSRTLTEWMAFFSLEPFGYEAGLQGNAITASVIAEIHRDEKKRKDPFVWQDFMPKEEEIKEKTDADVSLFQKLKQFFMKRMNQ